MPEAPRAPCRRGPVQVRPPRRRVAERLRGRPEHRRGVRPPPAPEGRRSLRPPVHRDSPGRRVPGGGRWHGPGRRPRDVDGALPHHRGRHPGGRAVLVVTARARRGAAPGAHRQPRRDARRRGERHRGADRGRRRPRDVRLDEPAVDDDAVAQVVVSGEVVTTDSDVTQPLAPAPDGSSGTRTAESVPDEDGAFRVASQRLDDDGTVVVHVAAPLDDVEESTGPWPARPGGPGGDRTARRELVGAGGTHAPAGRGDPPRGGARSGPPTSGGACRCPRETTRWRAWPAR